MKNRPGPAGALESLRKYCAYQERCHQEVRSRLLSLGIFGDTLEEAMATLIEEGFLNEMRFAAAFARGKFRMKGWGKRKIIHALHRKAVPESCIKAALGEIEEQDYENTLEVILRRQLEDSVHLSVFEQRALATRYALSRGYEANLIGKLLDKDLA